MPRVCPKCSKLSIRMQRRGGEILFFCIRCSYSVVKKIVRKGGG